MAIRRLVLVCSLLVREASGQSWPSRPIKQISPALPGRRSRGGFGDIEAEFRVRFFSAAHVEIESWSPSF
jgi:hypothetical protein